MSLDPSLDPNVEFMAKLKGESRLRILLSERRKPEAGAEQTVSEGPTEGLLPANHSKPTLFPSKNPYIEFYDMGRKWNGSAFVDVSYNVAPTYDYVVSGVASYRTTTVPTLAQLNTLRDTIFDYDVEDIENQHPRITKAEGEYFELLLGNMSGLADTQAHENENWTEKGWKTTQKELDAITNFTVGSTAYINNDTLATEQTADAYFNKLVLTGSSKRTITEIYDPAAPVVAYAPKPGDKFFLMPTMPRPNGWCRYRDLATNHGLGLSGLRIVEGYESYNFMVTPRLPIFDSEGAYYLMKMRNASYNNWTWNPAVPTSNAGDIEQYAQASRIINFMEAYGTSQERKEAVNLSTTFNDYTWHTYVGSGFPPGAFFPSDTTPPTSEAPTPRWIVGAGLFFGTSLMNAPTAISSLNPFLPTGSLMAIIKQKNKFYYVWK